MNETILIYSRFSNNSRITETDAINLLKEASIDAIIYLPENLSEAVNLNDNSEINITTIPDPVTKTVVETIFSKIISNIVLGDVGDRIPNLNVDDLLEITDQRDGMDYLGPAMLIMAILVNISNTANIIAYDSENGILRRLDTTPTPRYCILLGAFVSMSIIAIFQIVVLTLLMPYFGVFISPKTSLFEIILIAFPMVFTSIGLGLIIASLSKSANSAGGMSWIIILPLQMLGGAFFTIPESIGRWFPSYYAIDATRGIMFYGMTLAEVLPSVLIVIYFGLISMIIGAIIFSRKEKI